MGSSFLWFIFRILQGNPNKELLRGPGVVFRVLGMLPVAFTGSKLLNRIHAPCQKAAERALNP